MAGTQASRKGLPHGQQHPHPHLGRKAQNRECTAGTGYRAQESLLGFLEEVDFELGIGDWNSAGD